jgi:hypothetical protein
MTGRQSKQGTEERPPDLQPSQISKHITVHTKHVLFISIFSVQSLLYELSKLSPQATICTSGDKTKPSADQTILLAIEINLLSFDNYGRNACVAVKKPRPKRERNSFDGVHDQLMQIR